MITSYPEVGEFVRIDTNGKEVSQVNSAFGEQIVTILSPQWQQSFEYTVSNTELNNNTITNSGSVTQSNAMALISSGATANSTARLSSAAHLKYRAGLGGSFRFTAKFTTPVAGKFQYAAIVDEVGVVAEFKNGYALGYNGTVFTVARFQNDVLFQIVQSSWDDPLDGTGSSGMTLSPTNLNVFYIQFQYLGAGAIYFITEDPATGIPFKFHTIQYSNSNTVPSTFNPNFHVTFFVNNGSTTSNLTLSTASYGYFVEGFTQLKELHQPQFSTGDKTKSSVTAEVAICTIRNKTLYASKNNFIMVQLERAAGSAEASSANNLADIRLVKNATLGGTPVWADINTANSVVEIDVAGTTVTGGKELMNYPLAGKNDKIFESLLPYGIILHPGDSVTLAGSSSNAATIHASLLWKELF